MKKILYFLPRILAIAVILFFSVFVLEGFTPGFTLADSLVHLFLVITVVGMTVISWKYPGSGGWVFVALGIFFGFFFHPFFWVGFSAAAVPMLAGILFLVEGISNKSPRLKLKMVLVIIICFIVTTTLVYLAVFGRALSQKENHLSIALALPRAIIGFEAVRIDGDKYLAKNVSSFINTMSKQGFSCVEQMGSGYFFKKDGKTYLLTSRKYSSLFTIFTSPELVVEKEEDDYAKVSVPTKIVYLKPESSGQISDEDLKQYPQILVVHNFSDLKNNVQNKVGIWIDKESVKEINDEDWLNEAPQKNYPLVLIGYNNARYSFHEKLRVGPVNDILTNWGDKNLETGFSVLMLKAGTEDYLLSGFDRPINIEAVLIVTNDLLGEDNYKIAKVTDEKCSSNDDCITPFEYAIRSSCQYQSRCLGDSCAVVCNDLYDPEWLRVMQAIFDCQVSMVMQTHARVVTAKLKNGERIETIEPGIDDIMRLAQQAEKKCGKVIMATE